MTTPIETAQYHVDMAAELVDQAEDGLANSGEYADEWPSEFEVQRSIGRALCAIANALAGHLILALDKAKNE